MIYIVKEVNAEKKNGQTIFLSIIGVVTLLIAVFGATFSYFTANVAGNNTASSIIVNTATIASIEFQDTAAMTMTNGLPGTTISKNFVVKLVGTATISRAMSYKVYLSYTNTGITDLTYTLARKSDETDTLTGSNGSIGLASENNKEVGSGTFASGVTGGQPAAIHNWTMTVTFPETGSNQNSQQGKSFNGKLKVEFAGGDEIIYNSANPTGSGY